LFNFDIKIVLRKIWIVFLDEMCLWNYFFCIFFFFYFSDFLKATYIGSVDYQVTQEKVHLKEFRVKKLNLWYIFKYSWFIEKYFCKNLNGIIEIILFYFFRACGPAICWKNMPCEAQEWKLSHPQQSALPKH
jgi:hypothetical protein